MREKAEQSYPTDKQLVYAWKIIDKMNWDDTIKFTDYAPNNPEVFAKCAMMWIDSTKNGEILNDWSGFIKKKFFPTEDDKRAERQREESRAWSNLPKKPRSEVQYEPNRMIKR